MDGLAQALMPTRNPRRGPKNKLAEMLMGEVGPVTVDQGPTDGMSQALAQFGQLPQDQEPDWVMNPPAPNGNLPDQNTALGQAVMQEGADYGVGIARQGIGQGVMLGTGDEAEAWLRSRGSDRSYEDLHSEIDGQNKQFFEENTKASMAAQLAGSMVVPGGAIVKPLQLASKVSNPLVRTLMKGTTYTAAGATTGTIYGHNTGTGEMFSDNRMRGAKEGGTVGALLGPAVPVAANAVGSVVKGLANALRGGYGKAKSGIARALDDIGTTNQKIRSIRSEGDEAAQAASMSQAKHRAELANSADPEAMATANYYKSSNQYQDSLDLIEKTEGQINSAINESMAPQGMRVPFLSGIKEKIRGEEMRFPSFSGSPDRAVVDKAIRDEFERLDGVKLANARRIISDTEYGANRQGIAQEMGNIADPKAVSIMRGDLHTANSSLSDVRSQRDILSRQRDILSRQRDGFRGERDELVRQLESGDLSHRRPGVAVYPASPGASSHKPSGQADPSSTVSNPVSDALRGPPGDNIAQNDGISKLLMGMDDRVSKNANTLGINQQAIADGIGDQTRFIGDQNSILAEGIVSSKNALSRQITGLDDKVVQALKGHRTPLEAMPSEYSAINRSVMSRLLKDPQTAKGPLSPAGIADNLNAQYQQAGLKRVDLNELTERVGNTFDITRSTSRVLGLDINKRTGKPRKHVGQDKIRRKLLAEALGNPGTLAIPAAIGAGAAYSPDQFDELRRQLMEIN